MADEQPVETVEVPQPVEKEESTAAGAFDPSKKKKKKKVRAVDEEESGDAASKAAEKLEDLSVSDAAGGSLFAGLKKKKKKKPVEGEAVEEEASTAADGEGTGEGDDEAASTGLGLAKKKKKKPRAADDVLPLEAEAEEEEAPGLGDDDNEDDDDEEEGEGIELSTRLPWEGTDRDYRYEEMLGRVFNILRENNPELAGEKRRTVMRPPQVLREGTKKTVFVNFMDLCKTMHRQPEHVMAFLLAELGTSGSLDGQQRLVVKGRFAPKNFEGILRRYVNEYVMCSGCKSADTILSKENRLFFLRCEQCGCSRSVAPIKAGFVARVGRRKATA
eukprot:jgi/Mesen1/5924/ME000030S05184